MQKIMERAGDYIYRHARPLDFARWRYHFEEGSKEEVLRALVHYQNADGGFGHALEADAWNPHSSPIQTWMATDILHEIAFTEGEHPIIQGILRYLGSGSDFLNGFWRNTIESNNDYPHAPWWHTESVSSCHHDYNPTVCLAGFILRYAAPDSTLYRLGREIAGAAVRHLLEGGETDMHTISCYIRFMEYLNEAKAADLIEYEALRDKLHSEVAKWITRDTALWEECYVCRPSQFFYTRQSEFYEENRDIADYECAFIQKTQLEDGSWHIPWSWNGYPEEWAVSKNWWKANGIIKNMTYLRGFDRI